MLKKDIFHLIRTMAIVSILIIIEDCSLVSNTDIKDRADNNIPAPEGMVYIPPDEFLMGSKPIFRRYDTVKEIYDIVADDEKPQRKVYVDAFFMDKYEVSNAEFNRFIMAGGYSKKEYWSNEGWKFITEEHIVAPLDWEENKVYPKHPVRGVSWYEANAFASWKGKRLPTEAEWEKAAKGPEGYIYPYGNSFKEGVSRVEFNRHDLPVDVDSFAPNSYGLFNMSGNVCEWTADWYDKFYYLYGPYKNPRGPDIGSLRVLRGGAWYYEREFVRTTHRDKCTPRSRKNYDGFRLAMSVEDTSKDNEKGVQVSGNNSQIDSLNINIQ